jgi:hypothetical protein
VYYPVPGPGGTGGAGGDALSGAVSHAGSGAALANASAHGGAGGGSVTTPPFGSDPFATDPPLPVTPAGQGGSAQATATATSDSGAATALAQSQGGDSGFGGPSAGSSNGGGATANANAETSGADAANATAMATGGQAGLASRQPGGVAHAEAHAQSLHGDATATAQQIGGAGAASTVGPLVSSRAVYGGTGQSSVMLDQVSGAAAGRLTLIQQAVGGAGSPNGSGGSASSTLHATNPLGGDVSAEADATGGSGGGSAYPDTTASNGGNASASVTATDSAGSAAEAIARAEGGFGGGTAYGPMSGGRADAAASAIGLGGVRSLATAVSRTTYDLTPGAHARSDSLSSGPVLGAHADFSLTAQAFAGRSLEVESSVGVTAGSLGPTSAGERRALLAAAPLASDVAALAAGHANAEAAVADWQVVGLGHLGSETNASETGALTGSFGLDLRSASFGGPTQLELVFLDPTSAGAGLDLLHLNFSVDGTGVFDASFSDSATATAALDDDVVDLGALGPSLASIRKLVLSVELDQSGVTDSAYGFSFLVLAKAAVPEPVGWQLLACAAAAVAVARSRV